MVKGVGSGVIIDVTKSKSKKTYFLFFSKVLGVSTPIFDKVNKNKGKLNSNPVRKIKKIVNSKNLLKLIRGVTFTVNVMFFSTSKVRGKRIDEEKITPPKKKIMHREKMFFKIFFSFGSNPGAINLAI